MMKLYVKRSSTVCPAEETPNQRLWLSNIDLVPGNHHVLTVYFYRPNGSTNFLDADVLKEALRKVLVKFYPVAGRLGRDENGRLEINCNGEGVLFVEAETNITTSDLGDFLPGKQLRQLIPTVDDSASIYSFPLLVTQVTRFRCGGVSLGIRWHHSLADGIGALHFINSWSSIARGLSIGVSPILDRTILRAHVPTNSALHHIEYDPNPPMNNPAQNSSETAVANVTIRRDQLNSLKARANKETETPYSTFEVLTAHIWRFTCKSRGLAYDQLTKLKMSVDGRSRLHPPVPPGYFGNAIFHTAVTVLVGDLLSERIGNTAERIRKALKRMDDEYLRSAIDYLEERGDELIETLMDRPTTWKSPNLKINSWSRLPFYEADFGWGVPWLVRAASASDGKGHLQPTATDDGSYSLVICLETDHLQSFQKLFQAKL